MVPTVMALTSRAKQLTLPVTFAATVVTFALGYWQKSACQSAGWPYEVPLIFGRRCYSDVPFLLENRGMAEGIFPYAPDAGEHPLEYPVVSGLVMDATARLARLLAPGDGSGLPEIYFALTVVLMLGFALLTVWATVGTSDGARDGLLVAVAPTLALAGTINLDLIAVAATALAILAWTRDRPWLVGLFIGLGTAAKLYPLLLLGPIVLLCLRTRELRRAAKVLGAAAGSWLAVNLPVMIAYPEGWSLFYRFNQERGADFGSVWFALMLLEHPVEPLDTLNAVAMGLLVAACAGVAVLALRVRPVPELVPLAFLVIAGFLVTNKVYSPQYVLWLLPLAVLCLRYGVRLADLIVWQAAEVGYWFAIWAYLDDTAIDIRWYAALVFLRVAVTLWLCLRVVLKLTRPRPDRPGQLIRCLSSQSSLPA